MTSVAGGSGVVFSKKRSLLDKLDVPIHHLDFDFVKKCTDVKELEKIIRILRSKEEGHYPDLEQCAETQLAAVDSRNRLLRSTTRVMTKADLSKKEWNNITSDILSWKGSVANRDMDILESKSRTPNGPLPNIRNSSKGFSSSKSDNNKTDKSQRISSLDYKRWEKFDADEECKKIDLEEEQKEAKEKRETVEKTNKNVTVSIEELAVQSLGDTNHLTSSEREVMAVREKDVGNEFYNANKIDDAIKHYTRSIHLCPTIPGLNNRAAAYLRQCEFNKALVDVNKVIEMDPKNIKARFRRAQSYQHKNMFREALDDIQEVLLKEPSHLVARHIADQLRENIAKLPKMHRIKVKDKKTGKTAIKTVTEDEMLNDYKNVEFVEVNDWGFPKIMCNCNGKHSNDPAIRHEDHMRYQHLNKTPKKIQTVETPKPEKHAPIALPGRKLEIFEVEKSDKIMESGIEDGSSCIVADMRTTKAPESVHSLENAVLSNGNSENSRSEIIQSEESQEPANRKSSTPSALAGGKSKRTKNEKPRKNVNSISKSENEKSSKKPEASPKTENNDSINNRDASPSIENEKSQKTDKNSIIKDISGPTPSLELSSSKSSHRDDIKGVKTDHNSRIQDHHMMNGHGDNMDKARPCGCKEKFNKFQFKNEWSALSGPTALEKKSALLKSICPEHLVQAFGNSWEKEMLVDVFVCLRQHFSSSEQQMVADYLTALPRLDRYKINSMFLTKEEKSLARELVKQCSALLDASTVSALSS